MIVNGIHVCDHAKFPSNTKDPEDLTLNDILSRNKDFCVKFDHLPDIMGAPLNEEMGHGDIPDNYLCFEKGKIDQSMIPASIYDFVAARPKIMETKARDFPRTAQIAAAEYYRLHEEPDYRLLGEPSSSNSGTFQSYDGY